MTEDEKKDFIIEFRQREEDRVKKDRENSVPLSGNVVRIGAFSEDEPPEK